MAEAHEKSTEVQLDCTSGEVTVMGESQHDGADPNTTNAMSNDAARIRETFLRVMQKVKSAYHKELQRKKQVDLTASVDIMRNRTNEEQNDAESNEDDEAMQAMAKEIEVTRRLLEVSQLREEQSKQTIAQLEAEVSKLQKLVEEEEALRRDEGLTLQQLIALKKQLTVDNEKLSGENQIYSQQFVLLQTELQDATGDKKRLDTRLAHLQGELLTLREQLENEVKTSATIRQQRDAIQDEFDQREIEIGLLRDQLQVYREENGALESNQLDLEEQNQKLAQTSSALTSRCDQLVRDLESTNKTLMGLDDDNIQLGEQLKSAHSQIQDRLKEINTLETHHRSAVARIEYYEKECAKVEAEREQLESQLDKLEKELEQVRCAAAQDRQGSDKILRENRQLHVQLHEHLIAREKQSEVWEVQQSTIRRLENAVKDDGIILSKLRFRLNELEKENTRLTVDREGLRRSLQETFEKLNVKEKEVERAADDRICLEKRIHQLQSTDESSKQSKAAVDYELAKIKEENYEQEKRIKTLTYMVEKLKEELSSKEDLLMNGKRVKQQLEGDLLALKKTVEDSKKVENDRKAQIAQQEKQLQKLQLLLQQNSGELREATLQIQNEKGTNTNFEQRFSLQRDQLEEARNINRDLERRMQEISGVNKRLETDLSLMRVELDRVDQEKKTLYQKMNQSSFLQRDYENLRETLLHEQSRRAALETLRSTPVLVHPWRILQAANPTAYVTMMREQAAKRKKITSKGRTVLPDVMPRRSVSSFSRHDPNNDLQVALIKAII